MAHDHRHHHDHSHAAPAGHHLSFQQLGGGTRIVLAVAMSLIVWGALYAVIS